MSFLRSCHLVHPLRTPDLLTLTSALPLARRRCLENWLEVMPPSRRKAIGMPKAKKFKVSFAATDEVIEYDDVEATVEEEPLQALDDEPGDEPEPEPEARGVSG